MRTLVIRIDELVLRGFPAEHGQAIAKSLSAELERLLEVPDALDALGAGGQRRYLSIRLPGDGRATETGKRIAQAMLRRLGR